MTSATTRLSRISIAIAIAGGFAIPAAAGQTDYFLKIEGVEGEASMQGHGDWIEIQSLDWGKPVSFRGGARVAVGDVNNDGADRNSGKVEYEWKVEEGEMARDGSGTPANVQSADQPPEPVGLLVPAVQKLRATVKGNYAGCMVGNRLDRIVAISSSGKRFVLSNATITACNRGSAAAKGDAVPTESISLNFEKIK